MQFRSQRLPDGHAAGYQADIDLGAKWLGCIYDEHGRGVLGERGVRLSIAPDGRRWKEEFADTADYPQLLRPAAEWNVYRIVARASHLETWINGVRITAVDDHETAQADLAGKLALLLHSGPGPV